MGPVFYLVQCEEARCLISAVVLGNWPHEFALAPSPGKGGCALDRRLCLQRLPPSAEACGAREKSLARNSRHLDGALCCSVLLGGGSSAKTAEANRHVEQVSA